MQKVILIALLAVCIGSSVQGYVKRDAPAAPVTEVNYMDKIKEAFDETSEQLKKAFNPEDMKKNFDQAMEKLTKTMDDFRKQVASKPEAAKP